MTVTGERSTWPAARGSRPGRPGRRFGAPRRRPRGRRPLRRRESARHRGGRRDRRRRRPGRRRQVIAWSDGVTLIDGRISATGGDAGGFVETSGRFALGIGKDAEVSLGRGGEWLLDPRDVVIGSSGLAGAAGHDDAAAGHVGLPHQPARHRRRAERRRRRHHHHGRSRARPWRATSPSTARSPGPAPGDLRLEADRDIRIEGSRHHPRRRLHRRRRPRNLVVNPNVQANGAGASRCSPGPATCGSPRRPRGNVIVSTTARPAQPRRDGLGRPAAA